MRSTRIETAGPPLDEPSLEDRIESALLEHHVVDPRRLDEIDRMRAEVHELTELNDIDGAQRLASLCIDYIRAGQATKE